MSDPKALAHRDERLRDVTWESSAPQEQELLERVQNQLMERSDWWGSLDLDPKPRPRYALWSFGLASACAMVACIWVLWPKAALYTPQWTTTGDLTLKAVAGGKGHALQVPLGTRATLGDKGLWHVGLEGGTRMQLSSQSRHKVDLRLQYGRVKIHVTPGSMRRFVLHWQGDTQLVVKGTRFTVEQRKDWLRLEVQKGVVAIRQHGWPERELHAGQGIRVTADRQKQTPYTLPPPQKRAMLRTINWLAARQPKRLCQAALDWLQRPTISTAQKKALLTKAAIILRTKKDYSCAVRLWVLNDQLRKPQDNDDTALGSAAQLCHSHIQSTTRCVPLYRRYLSRYPKGTMHGYVALWFLQSLARQSSQQRKQAVQWAHGYLKKNPQGLTSKQIQSLLQKLAQTKSPPPR